MYKRLIILVGTKLETGTNESWEMMNNDYFMTSKTI